MQKREREREREGPCVYDRYRRSLTHQDQDGRLHRLNRAKKLQLLFGTKKFLVPISVYQIVNELVF